MATRTATRTDNLASRLRQTRRDNRARRLAADGSPRELLIVAFGLPLITLVVLLVLIVATLLLAGSDIGGLTGTLGAAWLAVHQVPISLSGVTIGALPMLPTLLVVAGTAAVVRSAGRDREVRELGAIAAAAVGGPLVFTAMAVAVVMDGASTSQIQSPDALSAFAYTLLVHAVGAGVGVGTTSREPLRRHVAVSAADRTGLRFGVVALFALLAAGGVVVTVRLILNWDQLGALFAGGYDFDGYLGLGTLSVLYLPNLVIGAAAVLVGANAQVGTASVDLMTVTGGDVPPLPALAALPADGLGTIGAVGFAVPAVIALFVAVRCRSADPLAHFRAVCVAGAVAAALMTVLAELAGGRVGELGEVGVTPVITGTYTLGWIVLVGGLVVIVNAMLPSVRAARAAVRGTGKTASRPDNDQPESDWDVRDWDEQDWYEQDEVGDPDPRVDQDDAESGDEESGDEESGDEESGDEPGDGGPAAESPENRDVDDASASDGAAFKLGEMDLDEYDTEHAISRKLLDRM